MNRVGKRGSGSDWSRGENEKEMGKTTGATPTEKGPQSERTSMKGGRNDNHRVDLPIADPYVSLSVAGTPRSRKTSGRRPTEVSDTDPYVALKIADTPRSRRSSGMVGNSSPYVSLKVAGAPRSINGGAAPSTDPYVSLRIAPSHRFHTSAENGDEVVYDSTGSSGTDEEEEDAFDFDESADEEIDEEELSESEGVDGGSEDIDNGYPGHARVSLAGSETEHRREERYARVSVAGSEAEYGKDAVREFPGYARVSVAGSEADYRRDGDGDFPEGYARVSVAGSEIDFGKDGYSKVHRAGSEAGQGKKVAGSDSGNDGYARLSVAGSEAENGRDVDRHLSGYARMSVAGSEVDHGTDVYARISVAGSDTEYRKRLDRQLSGYARVSVAGSEGESGKNSKGSVAGSEAEYGKRLDRQLSGYARISVSGSEGEHGKDYGNDSSGYARLKVAGSKAEEDVDLSGPGMQSVEYEKDQNFEQTKELPLSSSQDEDDPESWNEEYERYMELSPAVRAKLEYRVRVVLISPMFELKERKLSEFSDVYRIKFGEDVEATGFSSVDRLCRAMPHVVQRQENGELILVDSAKNRKAVSGIRSGLRRIVYDALKFFGKEVTFSQFEEKCSELLGSPLVKVLCGHGYDSPNVESLLKDLPDIARLEDAGHESRVYLCDGAEDPALTDGLLIKSFSPVKTASTVDSKEEVEDPLLTAKDSTAIGGRFNFHPEAFKVGSSLTLRSLKHELGICGTSTGATVSSAEHEFLQARLRMRILLAFHNSGRGIELRELPELYFKTFCRNLDLEELSFSTLDELARSWQDIFLFQECKPDWVFLVPSLANRRILNTLRTGLRSSVFSLLVETHPKGLEPLEFLQRLQQRMSGELWEVLDTTGYICSEANKIASILESSSTSDFQLTSSEEVCLLLDDLMDFVRLGSNEDGSVVVKLRNGEVPLVELTDCQMEEPDAGSFDELFVNLMMIAVDDSEASNADDSSLENGGFVNAGHVQSLVRSFETSTGLRSAHSPTLNSLKLKHEIRLILGCPEYSDSGVAWNKLSNVYKDRTGQELGSKAKVRSLLRGMPDIVCKDSLVGDRAYLSKTAKNLRVLSATRAGLRQVLFWALLKNPGGIWANLLEGWFTDFAGVSLATTLQSHGYEFSKSRPFFPVYVFLRDMSDLLQKKSATYEVYTWAGEVKDPIHSDASLLGLSELIIQYDPSRIQVENVPARGMEVVEDVAGNLSLQDGENDRATELVEDVMDKIVSNESRDDAEAKEQEVVEDVVDDIVPNDAKEGKIDNPVKDLADEISLMEVHSDREAEALSDFVEATAWTEHQGDKDELALTIPAILTLEEDDLQVVHPEVTAEKETIVGQIEETLEGDTQEEQFYEDSRDGGETEDGASDDLMPPEIDGERSETNAEAYAQLRVAGKGPKVNLDEWQFTDSEEEQEEEEEEEETSDYAENGFQEEDGSEYSETEYTSKEQDKTARADTYVAPKVKETRKDATRAWVLPSKVIPWK